MTQQHAGGVQSVPDADLQAGKDALTAPAYEPVLKNLATPDPMHPQFVSGFWHGHAAGRKRGSSSNAGVRSVQGPGYTWHPKECPCKSVQSEDCIENGCKWQRDPTLVPAELRVPAGVQQPDGSQQ